MIKYWCSKMEGGDGNVGGGVGSVGNIYTEWEGRG